MKGADWYFEAIDEDRDELDRLVTIVSVSSDDASELLTLTVPGHFDPDNHAATDALGAAVLELLIRHGEAQPGQTIAHMLTIENSGHFPDDYDDETLGDDATEGE